MTMPSAKENEFLWLYFLKTAIKKRMRNTFITVNVMRTPHIHKVLYRCLGQEKIWLVDALMGHDFMSFRKRTLTTSTALTINMSEWMSMCVSVSMCVQRERKWENKTEANVQKRSQKEVYHRQKNPVATLACCFPLFLTNYFCQILLQNHCSNPLLLSIHLYLAFLPVF